MTIGLFSAAILLILGYVVITKLVGIAFRLVIPLVLLVVLGGAGALSALLPDRGPERYSGDQYASYERGRPSDASSGSIGDLRLRDLADMAVDGMRSFLQGALALLNLADPEPEMRRRPQDDPRYQPYDRPRQHDGPRDYYEGRPYRDGRDDFRDGRSY